MLSFSRKTDYALVALAHLVELEGRSTPAREIAERHNLPQALVMKILKALHQSGILSSERGARGGYQIAVDLRQISLFDLTGIIRKMDGDGAENGRSGATEPPLVAVHSKLMRFLKDVSLADLVMPGRRIDVPLELVGRRKLQNEPTATALVG